jgi:catechol 2,3-dioxygenase-like lactoylglutathione lyase family enzyme
MSSPEKLSHVVLKTYDVGRMREFYCLLLNAHPTFESLPVVSFITYDEEHHRLGFALIPGPRTEPDGKVPGVAHIAFCYGTIHKLLAKYAELRDRGVLPTVSVNHGPTVSLYYRDPDKNNVEFYVDTMPVDKGTQFMASAPFLKNPLGIDFDPEVLLAKMRAGASEQELLYYDVDAEVDLPALLEKHRTALNFG